jgi:peptidyl-prolyl cis-trans isomerase A (cyclophilin A)
VSILLFLTAFILSQTAPPVRVVLSTDFGEIEIEMEVAKAPITTANFLKYVDGRLFDGGRFHRTVRPDNQQAKTVKIDVIQGAANRERRADFPPAIPLETTQVTGLSHKDGAVSMARAAPYSGRSEFFICVGDQPSLDFGGARNPDGQGFAAFGRVVRGMDVVRKIQMSTAEGETLTPPITIVSVRRK